MLLCFNAERILAQAAARAAHDQAACSAGSRPDPWARTGALTTAQPLRRPTEGSASGAAADCPRQEHIDHLLTVALVGGPDELGGVLADDARGWSPELAFSSRAEAQEALRACHCTLLLSDFALGRVFSAGAVHFAEWHLEARQPAPLLVRDDLLIEPGSRSLHLSGATIAETAHGRITNLRTYFDDSSIIEQVILHE